MRDRATEGGLAARAVDVDVDPLVVAGRVGEPVDAVLVDERPVADEQFGTQARVDGGDVGKDRDFGHRQEEGGDARRRPWTQRA